MFKYKAYVAELTATLASYSTEEKAEASRRYFPAGINCIGANAKDIQTTVKQFQTSHSQLTACETLSITEYLLKHSTFNEERLLAFALINKFVKRHYDDTLLARFEFWLEHYTDNWSLVDDLCIKTIYQFFMSRPHLIDKTQHWARSDISWCRRASNVVWVKFINRKIGKHAYRLDKKLVFNNCDLLLKDTDEFVQKSIGWLLKVTAKEHEEAVIEYINQNMRLMPRATIRYAIEKMDSNTRKQILAQR